MKKTTPCLLALAVSMILVSSTGCSTNRQADTSSSGTTISKTFFGLMPDGDSTYLYTLTSPDDITVKITNYGGIITEILTPDTNGEMDNIALGFDNLEQYLAGHPNFGALIGRFANRIARGTFTLDGETYTLAINNGNNSLHGGLIGFDDVVWDDEVIQTEAGDALELKYTSVDMEEGYPGNLDVTVVYQLTGNELHISYHAVTDRATPVNLTNHTYFNLDGEGTILDHRLTLNASAYTPVNSELIPTGEIAPVKGTPFDFLEPHSIGERIDQTQGGYDHNFVLDKKPGELAPAARLEDPGNGRILEVVTTEPGIQVYTGNFLDGSLKSGGVVYEKHSGICLETQHFPDSPNQPDFPDTILRPGEEFTSKTIYRFTTAGEKNPD